MHFRYGHTFLNSFLFFLIYKLKSELWEGGKKNDILTSEKGKRYSLCMNLIVSILKAHACFTHSFWKKRMMDRIKKYIFLWNNNFKFAKLNHYLMNN